MLTLCPVVAYAGNEGLAPLVGLGGLACVPRFRPDAKAAPGAFLIFALACWAAVSFLWSPYASMVGPLNGFGRWQALTAAKLPLEAILYGCFVFAALALDPHWSKRALAWFAISLTLIAAVLVVESLEGAALYRRLSVIFAKPWRVDLAKRNVANACFVAAALAWPAAVWLWRRGLYALVVFDLVAVALSAALLGEDAPILALALGGGAFGLVAVAKRVGVAICGAAAVLYFWIAPAPFIWLGPLDPAALEVSLAKASWARRLAIWRFASAKIPAHPLFGWGLDASRVWPQAIPMHPHDGAIQLWLETGAVGVALASAFWAWLFLRIDGLTQRDRIMGACAAATAAAYLAILGVSFGVWQEWWLACGAVAIAACALLAKARAEEGSDWSGGEELVPLA